MSKIDCSIAINYIKEKARLTENCTISCGACMLGASNTGENMECYVFENNMPEKAVEIIQEWSNATPIKTIKDDFLEKYPNATLQLGTQIPCVCPKILGYKTNCPNYMTCDYKGYAYDYCWNKPL